VIRMIVNRCHVGESNLAVIRYVLSRMKPGSWWALPKPDRHEILAEIIEAHKDNRDLYARVVTGRF